MSLRWRLLGAFILVIILTVFLSGGVAYWSTQRNLDAFITEIGEDEAAFLSDYLSKEYTLAAGWNGLTLALADVGYVWDEEIYIDQILLENQSLSDEELYELAYSDFVTYSPSRLVVVDIRDQVLFDSFLLLEPGGIEVTLPGVKDKIVDLKTGETVGYLYVAVEENFLVDESAGFLFDTYNSIFWGGILTTLIALVIGLWLAGRITAPVAALTKATEALAAQEEPAVLPVTSTDELGKMTTAFNRMTDALQTQRNLRKRLINDVSHELNTPLSVIQLETKGLKDGLQSPDEAADQITQEIERLRNLVHDLNWLAETDSDQLKLTLKPTDFMHFIETEVERWQIPAQTQQVELRLDPLPPLPDVEIDQMRISQVLGNVIRNCLQHTPPGGAICVGATFAPVVDSDVRNLVITVSDTGVGIEPEELPYLFERFYRTDQSRSRVSGGSGLGLPISRAIVEAHGGNISISSDGLEKGATVRIELPI